MPYNMPKFIAFAFLLMSFDTSSRLTLKTFDATPVCTSISLLNISIRFSSPESIAALRKSICEQSSDMSLKSLLPKDLDKKVKNPDTGKMIKVSSALKYDKDTKAYKAAQFALKKK